MRGKHVMSTVVLAIALALVSPTFLVHGELDKPSVPGAQASNAEEDGVAKVATSSKYPVIYSSR